MGSKIKRGAIEVLKSPWTATNFVIGTLEKLSSSTKAAEGYIMKEGKPDEGPKPAKEKQPSNIASGILRGAGALIKSLFDAIVGIFAEPIRGGSKSGFTGAIKGVGKGMIGLVLKPVHGTLDLVTLTARGITNTPKTVYLKVSSIFKKKVRKPRSTIPVTPYIENVGSARESVINIGESDNECELSLDVEELRRQLLEGLLSEGGKSVSEEGSGNEVVESSNKLVMKEIAMRQKKQKRLKKCRVLKIKHQQKHFRENLEKLLSSIDSETSIEDLMRQKGRFGWEVLSGMAEVELEGFPSPEAAASETEEEAECVREFNEDEDRNFHETCNEFAVKCNIVTLGVDNEEEHGEIVDAHNSQLSNLSVGTSMVYGKSYMQMSRSLSYFEGKFRKNPMHRAPPSISISNSIEMHNHHIKNPLFRTFTNEESKMLEEKKDKELRQELIRERLSTYQMIASEVSMLKKEPEKKVVEV